MDLKSAFKKGVSVVGKVADHIPVVSNVKGAIQGDASQAAFGAGGQYVKDAQSITGIPIYDAAGNIINRTLEGAGLKAPTDSVKAAGILDPMKAQASDLYKTALANQEKNAQWAGPSAIRDAQVVTAPTITSQGVDSHLVDAPTEGTADTRGTAATMGDAETRGAANTIAQAAEASPTARYEAALVNGPRDVSYGPVDTTVRADNIGPAATAGPVSVERAALGPAQTVAGTTVGRADIDRSEANAARGDLVGAARDIRSAPSAAGALYDAALGKIGRAQLGAASAARGADRVGLRRDAILNIGERGMEAASEKAGLSAQEEQAKRMGAASVLTGVRGQDVGVATSSAQLQQGTNLAQAGITHGERAQNATMAQDINVHGADLAQQANNLQAQINEQTALGNMAAVNDLRGKQASLNLAARQSTVQGGVQQAATAADVAAGNAGREIQVGTANAGAQNTASGQYTTALNAASEAAAGRQTAVNVGNVDRGVTVDEAAVQRRLAQQEAGLGRALTQDEAATTRRQAQEQANLDRGVAVNTTNVNNAQRAGEFTANAANTAAAQNATNNLAGQTTNANNALTRDTAQSSADLRTQEVKQSGQASTAAAAQAATDTGANLAGKQIDAATAQEKRKDDSNGRLTKTVTSIASALSDKRAKTDVGAIPDGAIADLANKLNAVSFRYKGGVADGGAEQHAGVMAQDLEKSPLGRRFVTTRPDGFKQVDYGQLATLLSAQAVRSMRRGEAR
jgi:hypothetical protein